MKETLFTLWLREKGFDDKQIVAIREIIDKTCHHCWEDDAGCQCWNDE